MDLIREYALCLGVCNNNRTQQDVHLLRLSEPQSVQIRPWLPGEHFEAGKWYKEQQKRYKLVEHIIPTTVVRTMDLHEKGQNKFECVLPIFFAPPGFIGIEAFDGNMPVMRNPDKSAMPICPLFGPDGIEVLPLVKWLNGSGSNGIYSDALYALKVIISYTSGTSPVWTPQLVCQQLKPWNYEQFPIVSQVCRENRTEGIVLDQALIVKQCATSCVQYCLISNMQAQLFVGVFSESNVKAIGEYVQFWPMHLNLYKFPLVLALNCPQESDEKPNIRIFTQIIEKCANNTFVLKIVKKDLEKISQDIYYHIPWLGTFMDAFHCVDDNQFQSVKPNENFVEIYCKPLWSLKKRSVCWIIIDPVEECSNASPIFTENSTGAEVVQSEKLKTIRPNPEENCSKSAIETSNSLFRLFSSQNMQKSASVSQSSINSNMQTALAVLLTVKDNKDLVFLFFNEHEMKFKYRIYANPTFGNVTIGNWYNLTYKWSSAAGLQNGQNIGVMAAKLVAAGPVETRVYNGKIAQFNSKPIFLVDWHKPEWHKRSKSDLPDAQSSWWPQLCLACYPTGGNAGLEQNKSQVKTGKGKREYTSVAPGHEEEYTDSESDTGTMLGSCVIGEMHDNSSSENRSENETSNSTASINYLVQCQFADLAEKPKLNTLNSPAESTKIQITQQTGNAFHANGLHHQQYRGCTGLQLLAKYASSSSAEVGTSTMSGDI